MSLKILTNVGEGYYDVEDDVSRHVRENTVGFLALNLKFIYSINFDDNKSDFFIDNFINLNRSYRRAWKNDSNAS